MFGGTRFEVVAKQSSEGYLAENGGLQDWTSIGSLKSKPINDAVFSIELNKLSKIITDDVGMHIVRVLERTQARDKSFAEAQAEIRKILSKERRKTELEKFRKTVMDRTPIWTLWPNDLKAKNVRPLSEALGSEFSN